MMDLAAHLAKAGLPSRHEVGKKGAPIVESADHALQVTSQWIQYKTWPKWWITDSTTSFAKADFAMRAAVLGIREQLTPGQAPWVHGALAGAVQLIKATAYTFMADDPEMDQEIAVYLAVGAHNRQEQVQVLSTYPWPYGKGDGLRDLLAEDRHYHGADQARGMDFGQLQGRRSDAEMAYLKSRALHRRSVITNSKVRQPLRNFEPGQWVYVWRRNPFQGYNRPHWFGPCRPCRVVVMKKLPRGRKPDGRGHIVWVLFGTRLVRCSGYSVRPASDAEEKWVEVK